MKKISFISKLALFLLLLSFITDCSKIKNKKVIILANSDWDSIIVNNNIARYIIEKGYGYPVKLNFINWKEIGDKVRSAEIDLCMEIWPQNRKAWYQELLKTDTIIDIGITIERAPQFFIIPAWTADKYNIKTIFDMKKHWQLFENPSNQSKGFFHNGPISWDVHNINIIKLNSYGLHKFYDYSKISSAENLDMALIRAQDNKQPVFGYYWAPTAIFGSYDWYILEEPQYNPECWEKIVKALNTKNQPDIKQACAYPDASILKIAHKNLQKKAPELIIMLKKMVIGLEPMNNTLAWIKREEVKLTDWNKIAIYYCNNYEKRWKTWVTPKAYQKIKKELNNISKLK